MKELFRLILGLQVSDSVKAYLEVLELPRPMTAGFKAVLHAGASEALSLQLKAGRKGERLLEYLEYCSPGLALVLQFCQGCLQALRYLFRDSFCPVGMPPRYTLQRLMRRSSRFWTA